MKIQDVEARTGLDRATIRFYEKEQLLIPERLENGYRNYTEADVELLQKIKLLRKLGVTLNTIKELEQGSEVLSEVLCRQIQALEQQIQDDAKAKGICKEMLDDCAQYNTLDPVFYLDKLALPKENTDFREISEIEIHPIRRYVARLIDTVLAVSLIRAFFVIIMRIRPFSNTALEVLTPILGYILCVIVSALLLHTIGTTAGKWLMGIKLEDPNGGKLSFRSAITREINVVIAGFGFQIPIFRQIRLYISYRDTVNGKGTEWDNDAEIQYGEPTIYKIVLAILAVLVVVALNYASARDAVLPKYRGNNISTAQFISNYQDYEKAFENDNTMILQQDGSWKKRTDYSVEITQIGDPNHIRKNFKFTYNENGEIKTIAFEDSWEDLSLNAIFPDYCYTVLYTALASQKGVSAGDLQQLTQSLSEQLGRGLEKGGCNSGEIAIKNIRFTWTTELPEKEYLYIDHSGGLLFSVSTNDTQDPPIPYTLEFLISIE